LATASSPSCCQSVYLTALGLSSFEVGALAGTALLGSALLTWQLASLAFVSTIDICCFLAALYAVCEGRAAP
jgi:hypothetical protein